MTMVSLHRSLRFFLLTIAGLLLLAACGGENEDITPPAITLETSIPSPTKDPLSTPLPVQATVDDPDATVTLSATPNSIITIPDPFFVFPNVNFDLHDLAEGANTVTITATDSRGNMNSKSFSVILDTAPPILLLGPYSNLTSETSVTIGGTAEANLKSLTLDLPPDVTDTPAVNLDAGFTWEYQLDNLQEGLNSVIVTAIDQADNKTTKNIDITFNSAVPWVTIDSINNSLKPAVQKSEVNLSGKFKAGSTVNVMPGDPVVTYLGGTWQATISGLTKGVVTPVTVTATDSLGNVGTATVDLIYNTAPKVVQPTVPKANDTNVSVNTDIKATFDQPVLNVENSFKVRDNSGTAEPGSVKYDPTTLTATFTPTQALDHSRTYTATLSNTITNMVGTKLSSISWSFTTSRP
jgi:hypothetical protein